MNTSTAGKIKLYLCMFFFFSGYINAHAQELVGIELKQPSLGFRVEFYGKPIGEISIDETNGYPIRHYSWVLQMTDEEHPNKNYKMDVWAFPDSIPETSVESFQDNYLAGYLYGKTYQRSGEKGSFVRDGCRFVTYFFKDKDGNGLYLQAGNAGNRFYCLSYTINGTDVGGIEGLQFARSFRLLNPPSIRYNALETIHPTCEILFPETPIINSYTTDDGLVNVIESRYNIPVIEEKDAIFEEEIVSLDDFLAQNGKGDIISVGKVLTVEYPIRSYVLEEIQFTDQQISEDADKNLLYRSLMEEILETSNGGKLLKYKDVEYASYSGKEYTIRDNVYNQTTVYRMYFINSYLYVMSVSFDNRTTSEVVEETVGRFFESFKLIGRSE